MAEAPERGAPPRLERRGTRLPIELPLLPILFASLGVGVITVDKEGRFTGVNPEAEALLGYRERELLGNHAYPILHGRWPDAAGPEESWPLQEILATERTAAEGSGESFMRRDGTALSVAWAAAPILLAGEVTGAVLAFYDTTKRPAAERRHATQLALAEEATSRLALVAEATTLLTGTLELREALTRLAELVVPQLADWSVVDLFEGPDTVERIAVAHRDPLRLSGPDLPGVLPRMAANSDSALALVLAHGKTVRLTDFPPPAEVDDPLQRAQLELFHRLGAADALVAPLRARGRTLGALTIVRVEPTDRYGPGDVQLLDDLARRAALAVDNARLFTEQRRFANDMQLALLPRLPAAMPGLELAARYEPASDLSQVGGDWYDAFELTDGSLALVIGDVVGHDVHAATEMSALRHKLRAIADDRLADPSEVLDRLDRVLQHFHTTEFATAIYARISRGYGTVQWSNAGHLPPVLVDPDGAAVVLSAEDAGLPLGVGYANRTDQRHELPEGAILLLYTDGLIERRDLSIEQSLDRLRRAAAVVSSGIPLDAFCDQLIDLLDPTGDDDVALLAIRRPLST